MRRWLLITSLLAIFGAKPPQANAQQQVRLEESKPADVSGSVVDASDGHLLRRATVCFLPNVDTNGYYNSQTERCDETDEKGRFTLRLPPGRYRHTVNREGYFTDPIDEGIPSVLALHAGDELITVKLRMRPAGALRGRVVFADGEPFLEPSSNCMGLLATGAKRRRRLGNTGLAISCQATIPSL